VQRRHDRHGEARQELKDVGAGFTAKNSELVLQGSDIETIGVQKVCCSNVVLDRIILDLEGDRSGIVIGLTVVSHRHDTSLQIWP
jgi:hypothetical protein